MLRYNKEFLIFFFLLILISLEEMSTSKKVRRHGISQFPDFIIESNQLFQDITNLKNGLIPIVTNVLVHQPHLFLIRFFQTDFCISLHRYIAGNQIPHSALPAKNTNKN